MKLNMIFVFLFSWPWKQKNSFFLGLILKFSNLNVLHKGLLMQDWVFRLGMTHWNRRVTEGAEFWITCKRLAFLSNSSRLQVIQNKRPWCSAVAYVTAGLKHLISLRYVWVTYIAEPAIMRCKTRLLKQYLPQCICNLTCIN